MTISERISRNARFLCKHQGKNISDMESAVGISTGYLSRVTGHVLRIDTVYALAEYLGVSIDVFVNPDPAKWARITELEAELAELKKEADNGVYRT